MLFDVYVVDSGGASRWVGRVGARTADAAIHKACGTFGASAVIIPSSSPDRRSKRDRSRRGPRRKAG